MYNISKHFISILASMTGKTHHVTARLTLVAALNIIRLDFTSFIGMCQRTWLADLIKNSSDTTMASDDDRSRAMTG